MFQSRVWALIFSTLSADFSQCANRHKENVSLSIDYSTIKVMVILNNTICDEYSWGEKNGD